MGKYIKLFETHAEYQTYINGQDKILPNVSYCEDNNDVHYNPWVETRLVAKFNVTSTSEATTIMYSTATSSFTEIEIDGIVQPSVVSSYTFDTTGEHTIKYTLVDPASIGNNAFEGCTGLTNVTIPDSVTSIGNNAFAVCTGLTSITIPSGVTSIGEYAFDGCTGLTNVTIPDSVTTIGRNALNYCSGLTSIMIGNGITSIGKLAFADCTNLVSITINTIIPPTLGTGLFLNTDNCTIYVPSESVEAYKSATNWSTYASRIQAIP